MSGQREATAVEDLIARVRAIPSKQAPGYGLLREEVAAAGWAAEALQRVLDLLDGDYTTWDVEKHLPGKGWRPDDPKVLAWEAAHGHDARLKCYPEFGCQLLLDPEDVRAALLGES